MVKNLKQLLQEKKTDNNKSRFLDLESIETNIEKEKAV